MNKHNRSCPKCGGTCIGCIFQDIKPGYDKDGYYWDGSGICCSKCTWELELRSANS